MIIVSSSTNVRIIIIFARHTAAWDGAAALRHRARLAACGAQCNGVRHAPPSVPLASTPICVQSLDPPPRLSALSSLADASAPLLLLASRPTSSTSLPVSSDGNSPACDAVRAHERERVRARLSECLCARACMRAAGGVYRRARRGPQPEHRSRAALAAFSARAPLRVHTPRAASCVACAAWAWRAAREGAQSGTFIGRAGKGSCARVGRSPSRGGDAQRRYVPRS